MTAIAMQRQGSKPKAAFNPLTQVTPLHAVWAEDPLWTPPADGAAVPSMRNASGGGDPAEATNRPLYRASVSQLGNRPAVEFDGVNDRLTFNIADTAIPFKSVVVFRMLGVPANTVNPTGHGQTSTGITISGTNFFAYSNGTIVASSVAKDTVGHVARISTVSSTDANMWLDGTQVITGAGAGAQTLTWIKLGCSGTTTTHSRFANCQIAFAGWYSGATSDSDLATLAADLKSFYAL